MLLNVFTRDFICRGIEMLKAGLCFNSTSTWLYMCWIFARKHSLYFYFISFSHVQMTTESFAIKHMDKACIVSIMTTDGLVMQPWGPFYWHGWTLIPARISIVKLSAGWKTLIFFQTLTVQTFHLLPLGFWLWKNDIKINRDGIKT